MYNTTISEEVQSSHCLRIAFGGGRYHDRADRLNEGVKRLTIAKAFVCHNTSPRPHGASGSNGPDTLEWV